MKPKKPYFRVTFVDGTEMKFQSLHDTNDVISKNEHGFYVHKATGIRVLTLHLEEFDVLGKPKHRLLYPERK
jgi:hypothetical protein